MQHNLLCVFCLVYLLSLSSSSSSSMQFFVALEAVADGGVKMGIPRETAYQIAAQTMLVSLVELLFHHCLCNNNNVGMVATIFHVRAVYCDLIKYVNGSR